MKFGLHKGPSGVGRPVVGGVGVLCRLTMWAVDVQFGTVPILHRAGWGQAQIARCKFGTGLEMQKFLPNKNGPSFWEGP